MKQISILHEFVDDLTGIVESDVEVGYLIAPGIAVSKCSSNTIYFMDVSPADGGDNLFVHNGVMTDIILPPSANIDITSMPAEALTFAMWAAGYGVPAVAV